MATETLPSTEDVEIEDQGTVRSYLPMYKIIMWNDDVRVLVKLFGKDYHTAERLMYEIHASGAAHVATLPLEQAEFKVEQVHAAASLEQFPFTCTIEPA